MDEQHLVATETHALQTISRWPLCLEDALFCHYPAMKLGHGPAVAFYGEKLTALAAAVCEEAEARGDWVVTAPPIYYLPAGANLLARQVYMRSAKQGKNVELYEPKLVRQAGYCGDGKTYKPGADYCKNGVEQRVAARKRQQENIDIASMAAHVRGKDVLVVNDINVTGTQQYFMQEIYARCEARSCRWLYIFEVDPALAAQCPELEFDINHSKIQTLESFARVLDDPLTEPTSRCIERLYAMGTAHFQTLAAKLEPGRRQMLCDLAVKEGCYGGEEFIQKMQILAAAGA